MIPTFQPGRNLLALVQTLTHSMPVLISDDASPCTSDRLLSDVAGIPRVSMKRHARNRGIARGLNDGLRLAQEHGARWLLTLDQDTSITADYVPSLLAEAELRNAGGVCIGAIGAEIIADPSGDMRYPITNTPQGPITEELIQTGTLWSVAALTQAHGFNEEFGIDAVDAAACLALRERGYAVCIAPGTRLRHEIGAARTVRILGHDVMVTGHSPERRSSMLRNRLRLFPGEYAQSPKHAFRTLRRVTLNQSLGLIVERDRGAKAKGTFRGLWPSKDG